MHNQPARRESVLGFCFCALLGFFVAIHSGCAKRETDAARGIREQVLHRGLSADPSGLDPHLITGLPEINVASALFEGLVGEDPVTGRPVPAGESAIVASVGLRSGLVTSCISLLFIMYSA